MKIVEFTLFEKDKNVREGRVNTLIVEIEGRQFYVKTITTFDDFIDLPRDFLRERESQKLKAFITGEFAHQLDRQIGDYLYNQRASK